MGGVPRPKSSVFDRSALERSIPDRFARQVRRFPERSAVEAAGRVVSYTALDGHANRVAHAVLASGASEHPVALLASYGPTLVAGMLGILKSGAAFVPLDPTFPAQRSQAILESAGCTLILCDADQRPLAERLAGPRLQVMNMDAGGDDPGDPGLALSAHSDAYYIYTSGSTGRPKGVVQTHRIVLHNILKYTNNLALDHEDRWSLLFSPSFGEAMNDLFCALFNGGAVCLYDLPNRGTTGLLDWLVHERITVYHSVPTVYRRMLEAPVPAGGFPHLRAVVLGGEPVHRRDVERHRDRFGRDCLLVNAYGSTETKLIRHYLIDADTPLEDGRVPVGYPVADTEVVVLATDGTRLAPGRVGEIAVRSHFLARYQAPNDDDRFSELPDGRRQFRTGDRGRLDVDGRLHHMGRLDDQVKIRGARVELAEVEAACVRLAGVREAVVTVVDTDGAEPSLVAYIVTREASAASEAAFRRALAEHLTSPMIPARFVVVDELPVTLTGKADRRALPAPEDHRHDGFVAPRTRTERLLAQIWQTALDLPSVGMDDDFFALGGDSLAAISIVIAIEQALGKRFPYSLLVERPTVRELAAALDDPVAEPAWKPISEQLVALMTSGEKTPFFCVHPNSGSVLGFQALARELAGIRPVYAFRAPGLSEDAPQLRVEDLAASYLEELLALQARGPYLLGGRCTGAFVAYEMALQLQSRGQHVALLVAIDATVPPASLEPVRSWLARARRMIFHAAPLGAQPSERPPQTAGPHGAKRLFQTLHQAHLDYAAEPYRGRIALVLADEPTPDGIPPAVERWRSHARGGLDWIQASGTTKLTLLEDPHVSDVAKRLDALFAQAETSRAVAKRRRDRL